MILQRNMLGERMDRSLIVGSRFLIFMLLVILSGCADGEHGFSEATLANSEDALVYVYRLGDDGGAVVTDSLEAPYLSINGKSVAKMKKGSYTVVEIKPGPFTVALSDTFMGLPMRDATSNDVLAKSGENYFFQIWYRSGALILSGIDDDERAHYGMKNCNYVSPSK